MDIQRYDIDGLVLLTPRRFEDARGHFMETFRQSAFEAAVGSSVQFVQDNQSLSVQRGTIRGLHGQTPPHAQGKLIRCTQGAIVDVAVDARANSPTYGQHIAVELNPQTAAQLWVPPGFLHGFSTLADNTVVQYKCTAYYAVECDFNIAWNDPDLGIAWGIDAADAVLSDKDAAAPAFADFKTPF